MVELFNKVTPNKQIPLKHNSLKAHMRQWKSDELYLGDQVSPHNILENEKAMSTIKSEHIFNRVVVPTLVLKCGLDNVVCNQTINEFFREIPNRDKMMITYDDVDHSLF